MNEAAKILSEGLKAGFAGKSKIENVKRGSFDFKSSHVEIDGEIHHDEWTPGRTGGGQEIVRTKDGREYTRVYIGGTIFHDKLAKLGISEEDVMSYLKGKLEELGDKTRLDADCMPIPDGDFEYYYGIIAREKDIPLTLGRENIMYQDVFVFTHFIGITPVDRH